jgi:hypothetical protein
MTYATKIISVSFGRRSQTTSILSSASSGATTPIRRPSARTERNTVLLALIVKRQGQSSRLEAGWAVYVLLDMGNARPQQSMCEPTQGPRGGQLFAISGMSVPSGCGGRFLRYEALFQRSSAAPPPRGSVRHPRKEGPLRAMTSYVARRLTSLAVVPHRRLFLHHCARNPAAICSGGRPFVPGLRTLAEDVCVQ